MTPVSAPERLRRLLSLVPWVAARDGATIEEIGVRFGISREELLADLEVVFMVGTWPFTPDTLIDVVIEDDRVWIHYAELFSRPLRLTADQALGLVAAGSTLLAVPGAEVDGALGRGLGKLAAVLGVDPEEALDVDLGAVAPATLDLLQRAVASNHRVALDYYAYGRDQRTSRVVDPYRVFADQGQWYLMGHDHLRGEERVFRVDRITAAELLDERFDPPAEPPELEVFRPGPGDRRVVLDLEPGARWVLQQYPVEAVEERPGGGCRVTLAVTAVPWLERLLLRLGPDATVVEDSGDPAAQAVLRGAAARVLDRYARREA